MGNFTSYQFIFVRNAIMSLQQSELTFIASSRGGRILVHNDYMYVLDRSRNSIEYWKCKEYRTCRGRLTLNDGKMPAPPTVHSCDVSATYVEAEKAKVAIKKRAAETMELPRQLVQNVTCNLPVSVCVKLSSDINVSRMVQRERKKDAIPCAKPRTLADIDTSFMQKTIRGDNFLLHDSGPNDDRRFIVFATSANLAALADTKVWLADGTFKVSKYHD